MSVYYGYLICKKCEAHGDWRTIKQCPSCGHDEGELDE